MDLLSELKKNPFLLAPMAGITDRPFRSFMRELGCGVVTTELVSSTGLNYSSEKTRRIMEFDPCQHPVGVQIFGEDLEHLSDAAKAVEDLGADFIDLNFGCPVPKVVKKGGGSAVLKDLVRLRNVLRAVKAATKLPVTIKVRTGWTHDERNSVEVSQIAYDEGMTWMSIHGRSRAQAYKGKADWDYIKEVKAKSPLPIIGNGDITSAELAVKRLKESGCDGVMIGRGCLKNPWIFSEALQLLKQEGRKDRSFSELQSVVEPRLTEPLHAGCRQMSYPDLFGRLRFHLENSREERITMLQTKKLAAWFSSGYPGSANFRKKIFQIQSKPELYTSVESFFSEVEKLPVPDTSHEDFLMGGHG